MIKQVIIIRKDLNLRRGKECAQVAHASMMWLSHRLRDIGSRLALAYALGLMLGCIMMKLGYDFFPSLIPLFAILIFMFVGLVLTLPIVGFYLLFSKAERIWLLGSFTKVCLQVDGEEKLMEVYQRAKNEGLMAKIIIDSGKTEFHGVPTATAVAIGPDYSDKIDEITGNLKLY